MSGTPRLVEITELKARLAAFADEAEHGQTFLVTRGGAIIASFGPASLARYVVHKDLSGSGDLRRRRPSCSEP